MWSGVAPRGPRRLTSMPFASKARTTGSLPSRTPLNSARYCSRTTEEADGNDAESIDNAFVRSPPLSSLALPPAMSGLLIRGGWWWYNSLGVGRVGHRSPPPTSPLSLARTLGIGAPGTHAAAVCGGSSAEKGSQASAHSYATACAVVRSFRGFGSSRRVAAQSETSS